MGSETGIDCTYKPDDFSGPRATEFMAGMDGEDPKERDRRITAFKEAHGYLFNCYDAWKNEDNHLDAETSYSAAVNMLNEYGIITVDEESLNHFLECIYNERQHRGIFLSAMINTIYRDERISIYPEGQEISYIGMNNDGKEIFVWGWLHDFAGMNMKGGSMKIMQGVSGTEIGKGMEGGTISIGDAHGYKINTDTQLSQNIKGGEIYYNERLIWPEMTFGESAKKWANKLFSQ